MHMCKGGVIGEGLSRDMIIHTSALPTESPIRGVRAGGWQMKFPPASIMFWPTRPGGRRNRTVGPNSGGLRSFIVHTPAVTCYFEKPSSPRGVGGGDLMKPQVRPEVPTRQAGVGWAF